MSTRWKLHIRKEAYKFSAAHMTVFPDGTKEALHGHNYQVALDVEIDDAAFEKVIPFAEFKAILGPLCRGWDERVLIQGANPFVTVKPSPSGTEVLACGKRYLLPSDEVVVLKVDNITTETLACELGSALVRGLESRGLCDTAGPIRAIEVRVDESSGQGASWCRRF